MNNNFQKTKLSLITLLLLLFTPSILAVAPQKTPPKPKKIQQPLSQQPEAKKFIQEMVRKDHFNRAKLIRLFNKVKMNHEVLKKVKHPYEALPWFKYQQRFVNTKRIQDGVIFWNKYAKALARAEKQYGVPASIIVAIIGIESDYGKQTGKFRVIDALSTIAFKYSKRAHYFRSELENFLLLCREAHTDPLTVYGSYAGAIGQPQFMPSSFRNYAVDFSNNGQIDLSNDVVDVIGSIANYFKKHGWKKGRGIALKAKVKKPYLKHFPRQYQQPHLTLSQLAEYNLQPSHPIPSDTSVSIVQLQSQKGKIYWLGLQNLYVITRYNASVHYAMAAYKLSREIEKARNLQIKKHQEKQKALQQKL
jgi:membrane-bound lytic murein transglycosylase B